jgi:putative tryptophan/tyrosine transport system substrate-binding protein
MRRRQLIAGLGSAAAWPLAARAQQLAMPVIGFLHGTTLEAISPHRIAAFHHGLAEVGYVEGRKVAIEYRWAEGQNDRLPALAADLVRRKVAVIVAPGSTMAALVAKAATQSIPIVFMIASDSVELGLVAELNRPAGNLTGISLHNGSLAAKCLEFLHELVPAATSIAVLFNPTNPALVKAETRELQFASRILGVRLLFLEARGQSEFESAFAALVRQKQAPPSAPLSAASPAVPSRGARPRRASTRCAARRGGGCAIGGGCRGGRRLTRLRQHRRTWQRRG